MTAATKARTAFAITSENFPQLVAEFVKLLGEPWQADEIKPPHCYVDVNHPEGYQLHLSRNRKNDKQLRVRGDYPAKDANGRFTSIKPYGVSFEQGFSTILTMESIVKQVQEKILKDYIPSYQKALESHLKDIEVDLKRDQHVNRLAEILQTEPVIWKEGTVYKSIRGGISYESQSYPSGTNLVINSIPYDIAEELTQWLWDRTREI